MRLHALFPRRTDRGIEGAGRSSIEPHPTPFGTPDGGHDLRGNPPIVKAELDPAAYEKGRKVSDDEMGALNLVRGEFHGEWNYRLAPVVG